MATVGNKIANDYYEHKMPTGYRKPHTNSSPEECRRFVDEKYIRKAFAPAGYEEPVKEFVACRTKGTKPDFGYSQDQQAQSQTQTQPQPQSQPDSFPNRFHTEQPPHGLKYTRKKSLSLDKLPEHHFKVPENQQKKVQQQQHHHQDLLSSDYDLLGSHTEPNDVDHKQTTHSASPVKKINFANFKKAQSQPVYQPQPQPDLTSLDWGVNNSQPQNANGTGPSDTSLTSPPQSQSENKVDLMKLYSQPQGMSNQNHFAQGMHQGWQQYNHGWHQGMNQGYNGGHQSHFQGGFQPNYGGQQGFHPNHNIGYNPYMNTGIHMAGPPNTTFGQGPVQAQYGTNPYANSGIMQAPSTNQYF